QNLYYRTFPAVEVQQTFYEPPPLATLRRWREAAPEDFEFTMKAWQLITHRATSGTYRRLKTTLAPVDRQGCGGFQATDIVLRAWETTLACARTLRASAILFQCPASFRPTDENVSSLRNFFSSIERAEGVKLLFEPRGQWPDDLLRDITRELELVDAVDPFLRSSVTPDFLYWRLHGIGSFYRPYTDEELGELIARLPARTPTYVMFNNIPRPADARRFMELAAIL
ncbi:MAG: DUF72 domain-containing protein, partial [Thermoanaerobaculia bacterium]